MYGISHLCMEGLNVGVEGLNVGVEGLNVGVALTNTRYLRCLRILSSRHLPTQDISAV